MPAKCSQIQYWVRLDENFWPISGTMQGFPKNNPPCDSRCVWSPLQITPYIAPVGTIHCVNPNGFRYFYKLNRKTGAPIPNSFVEMLEYPDISKDNQSCYLEYKKFCPAS